jgi:hypothetical protein
MKWILKKKKQRINETKSWFFEKINKIDKPFAKLNKRRKKTQMNKVRCEKGYMTSVIQRLTREYLENLYSKT